MDVWIFYSEADMESLSCCVLTLSKCTASHLMFKMTRHLYESQASLAASSSSEDDITALKSRYWPRISEADQGWKQKRWKANDTSFIFVLLSPFPHGAQISLPINTCWRFFSHLSSWHQHKAAVSIPITSACLFIFNCCSIYIYIMVIALQGRIGVLTMQPLFAMYRQWEIRTRKETPASTLYHSYVSLWKLNFHCLCLCIVS